MGAAAVAHAGWSNARWRGFNRFRRLNLPYERRPCIHEAFLLLGCSMVWNFLKPLTYFESHSLVRDGADPLNDHDQSGIAVGIDWHLNGCEPAGGEIGTRKANAHRIGSDNLAVEHA